MPLIHEDQKRAVGPIVNVFQLLVTIFVFIALTCRWVLSGYPPAFMWLEPFAELVIILGAIMAAVLVWNKNKLVKR